MQIKLEEFNAMSISDILKKLDRLDELESAVEGYEELVQELRKENLRLENLLGGTQC